MSIIINQLLILNFEIFPEYLEVVKKLKDSHNNSTQQLMAMLDQETA